MIALLAAVAFAVLLYAIAAWLLFRDRTPRRQRWTHGRRT